MQISKSILTLLKKERKLREIYTQVSGFTEVRNSTSDQLFSSIITPVPLGLLIVTVPAGDV